jgi:hypothetical protein
MKRISRVLVVFLILTLSLGLIGCGSAYKTSQAVTADAAPREVNSAYSMSMDMDMGYPMTEDAMEVPAEAEYGLGSRSAAAVGAETPNEAPRSDKIIYNANVRLETTAFDEAQERIAQLIRDKGGYTESTSISGSNYSQIARGYEGARSASYTIRIPCESFQEVMTTLSQIGNVPYSETSSRNVTRNYYDTQMRLEAFRTQEKRLLEMLAVAETVEDMLAIQAQLTEVQYEIDSLTGSLRYYDDQVSYSTIYLSVQEVREYTPQPTITLTYWQRMAKEFKESLKGTGEFFKNAFLWLIVSLPWLIPLAVCITVILLLLRRARRNSPAWQARAEKRAQRKAEKARIRAAKKAGELPGGGKDDPAS